MTDAERNAASLMRMEARARMRAAAAARHHPLPADHTVSGAPERSSAASTRPLARTHQLPDQPWRPDRRAAGQSARRHCRRRAGRAFDHRRARIGSWAIEGSACVRGAGRRKQIDDAGDNNMNWDNETGQLRARRFRRRKRRRDPRRAPRLAALRDAQRQTRQSHSVSQQLLRAACGHVVAGRARRHSRSDTLVHRRRGDVLERRIIWRGGDAGLSSPRHHGRQRAGAAPSGHRNVRRRQARRRLRIFDGRHPGLSLGGVVSRHGRARLRGLRQRPHRRS